MELFKQGSVAVNTLHFLSRLVLSFILLAVFSVSAYAYTDRGDHLSTNQYLGTNHYLVSPNKHYFAIMQGDGNFVVYRGSSPGSNQGLLWATNTAAGASFLIIQGDSNLVLYRGTSPGNNLGYAWGTGRKGASSPSLKLMNNGQVQIVSDKGIVHWETPADPNVALRAQCKDDTKSIFAFDLGAHDRGVKGHHAYLTSYGTYKQCLTDRNLSIDFDGHWNEAVRNYCLSYFNTAVLGGVDDHDYFASCFSDRWVTMPRLYIQEYTSLYLSLFKKCNLAIDKDACINLPKLSIDQALSQDWPGATANVRVAMNGTKTITITGAGPSNPPSRPYSSNLALGQLTSQKFIAAGGLSSRAVDGNTSGTYASGSITHTRSWNTPFWKVSLDGKHPVTEVILYNRTDCCTDRLSNFHVDLLDGSGNVLATKTHLNTVNKLAVIKFDGTHEASAVRVQLNKFDILSLAEVVVKANAALSKPTSQSSTGWGGNSGRAVDGNNSGIYSHRSITHTDYNQNAWWKVDLQQERNVGDVVIWNRTDCCNNRLSSYAVELVNSRNQVVKRIHVNGVYRKKTIDFGGAKGQTVRVRLNGANYLSLAEVEVFTASQVPN